MNREQALLDPRWHWMQDAIQKLYAEMDSDSSPAGLSLIAVNNEELVTYTLSPGNKEIERRILINPSALIAAVNVTTVNASVSDDETSG